MKIIPPCGNDSKLIDGMIIILRHMDRKIIVLTLFISVAAVTILILGLKILFTKIANNYIKRNRDSLFKDVEERATKNKNDGIKLLKNISVYTEYIEELGINQEYECSSSIVANASNNHIKYLIKYSNIDSSEYCLECIDFCICFMNALKKFQANMKNLQVRISRRLPWFVRIFATMEAIPYMVCGVDYKLAEIENPEFSFLYVSPAGRSKRSCDIEITPNILKNIQAEISKKIERSGHSKLQRNAMTTDLREAIKKRDNYTCCICGNSIYKEPNLLLEVDHIIPISKGGKTEANNLQTLCWRCNRKKFTKSEPST